jgi:hypothetical protein
MLEQEQLEHRHRIAARDMPPAAWLSDAYRNDDYDDDDDHDDDTRDDGKREATANASARADESPSAATGSGGQSAAGASVSGGQSAAGASGSGGQRRRRPRYAPLPVHPTMYGCSASASTEPRIKVPPCEVEPTVDHNDTDSTDFADDHQKNGGVRVQMCVVCLERGVRSRLLPCKHTALCIACARRVACQPIPKCPICYVVILEIQRSPAAPTTTPAIPAPQTPLVGCLDATGANPSLLSPVGTAPGHTCVV